MQFLFCSFVFVVSVFILLPNILTLILAVMSVMCSYCIAVAPRREGRAIQNISEVLIWLLQ